MSRKPAYEKTTVAVGKTIGEVRDLLQSFAAQHIAVGEDADYVYIRFRLPDELPVSLRFSQTQVLKRLRSVHSQTDPNKLKEQSHRTVWRQAYYYIKATLETVELGLFTIYQGFLAGFVGPDGRTLGEAVEESEDLLRDWSMWGAVPCLPASRQGEDGPVIEGEFTEAG